MGLARNLALHTARLNRGANDKRNKEPAAALDQGMAEDRWDEAIAKRVARG